jgi:cytoskeletal protein RodZ
MDGMIRASEHSPSARRRGLRLASRTNRWLATGAVILTAGFSVAAAKEFHSTDSSSNSTSSSTTSDTSSSATSSSDTSSSTSSLQQPTQTPSSTSSSSTSGVVSGGS